MPYEITYHTEENRHVYRFWVYGIAAILLFACVRWPGLLPESNVITGLIESLQAGHGISEAVSAFCQEIFTHGH